MIVSAFNMIPEDSIEKAKANVYTSINHPISTDRPSSFHGNHGPANLPVKQAKRENDRDDAMMII